jgi:hypothetical protein
LINVPIMGSIYNNDVSRAENRLSRQINYTLISRDEFNKRKNAKDSFLMQVLAGPIIIILGSIDETRR